MHPFIYILNRQIPLYGLCIVIGVFIASSLLILCCKKDHLCWENALIIGVTGLGFGLLGAKIFYIIISFTIADIINILLNGNITLFLNGGFVFYGGLIGGFLGALLGTKIANCKLSEYEDNLILIIPLVHFFGRIGCLCAGCCYGKPTTSAFGIIYKNPIGMTPIGIPLIPIQLYEALYNLLIFIFLFFIKKRKKEMVLPYYMILYAVGRFFIEFFRYDYFRGIYFGLSTSQIISIFIVIIGLIIIVYRQKQTL